MSDTERKLVLSVVEETRRVYVTLLPRVEERGVTGDLTVKPRIVPRWKIQQVMIGRPRAARGFEIDLVDDDLPAHVYNALRHPVFRKCSKKARRFPATKVLP